jgi:hypothetical protein
MNSILKHKRLNKYQSFGPPFRCLRRLKPAFTASFNRSKKCVIKPASYREPVGTFAVNARLCSVISEA